MPAKVFTIKCAGCGAVNRVPPVARLRCGKCKREFTQLELQAARLGDRIDIPQPGVEVDPDELTSEEEMEELEGRDEEGDDDDE